MPLTDLAVRQAKPKEKPYKLTDGGGLYLHVQPSGGRYWRLKYRVNGREKLLALGTYPDVSLADARDRRDDARKVIAKGGDPGAVKKEQKEQARALAENSFEQIAREWHEKQKGRWVPDHAARVLKAFEKEIFPEYGDMHIDLIQPPQVLASIRKIEDRGLKDYPARVLTWVRATFRYAVQTGRGTVNPAADLAGALKTHKVTHRPALSRADLPEFLERLDAYEGQPLTRLGLRLLLLTFVRSRELRGARWEEFDLERAEWRIPGERMKMRAEHIVPLSKQAIAVLRELQPLTGRHELVFPGQNNLKKPMSENTLLYAMYRMGYHSQGTPHGFRATASTILNESGFTPDAIERQLAHAEQNKVRAAYHRSEYLEERKKLMQWWADYLDGLASGANVVPFHGKRAG